MELDVSPSQPEHNVMDYASNTPENKYVTCNNNDQYSVIRIPEDGEKSSKHSSKKQSKRRKKSSNHSRPLPRIIVKPLPPPPPPETREWTAATSYTDSNSSHSRPSTMREVLASIPGFCIKPRKRSSKKLSTAAQLQQTREGCIDLETPDSILVNTNIRALLNKHTFSMLPPLYQYKLGQLLPSVDRLSPSGRLNSSSLNNEFFARACIEWQDSLSGGEFTPENQQKMKTEAEKEKSKIDPWKLKHFEPFWGEKSRKEKSSVSLNADRPSLKTTIKLRPTASITSSSTVPKIKKSKSSSSSKRMRSVGAVTRSSAKSDDVKEDIVNVNTKSSAPVPDLLPIKHVKSNSQAYEELQVDCNFSDTSSIQRLDDSVSTTPVDPLLLPDVEDRNELKQELDITIVTIEESNTSKDCDEDKVTDFDSNIQECSKRLSDDNEDYGLVKRTRYEKSIKYHETIQYEDEYDAIDNARFLVHNTEVLSNNCSDTEGNYGNEQVCPSDELIIYSSQDHIDTNSEDSKATASVYEYDERSESSISSLKIETNVNDAVMTNECADNTHTPSEENAVIPEESSDVAIIKNTSEVPNKNSFEHIKHDIYETEPVHGVTEEKLDSDQIQTNSLETTIIEEEIKVGTPSQSYEVVKQDELVQQPKGECLQNINSTEKLNPKCEKKISPSENNVQNYYDEHFKDAESFIMETSLGILTPQNEEVRYTHPLMDLSSYMNETNVTAVVSMPLTQNNSLPMMEVTNTSIVSYPDDSMQDPVKPKNSIVSWKTNNDWPNNENVMALHTFSTLNNDGAKYLMGDSKSNIDDVTNDENCLYKEERDANYNMESSNSSESCQSMKETVKQEYDVATSLVSSTTVTNPSVNSTTMTQSVRPSGKKTKIGKDSNRSRSSNKVPPGAVNLERSYQICQAVIQNSPNRDALRGQLRPPPALLARPARAPSHPPPPAPGPARPLLVRHLPLNLMPHEVNENRSNNVGQYILVQRTPNVAPRASSAPPANQNTNVSVSRCRSVGAEEACVCNLRAMVLCKKCGAFCHDDCLGAKDLCLTCLIR